jgi:hypothetical protein
MWLKTAESLPSKHKALSSNPSAANKTKQNKTKKTPPNLNNNSSVKKVEDFPVYNLSSKVTMVNS